MKTTLFMVMSVNGFVADKNGSEDFLTHDNWIEFVKLSKQYGAFVWGRKTYEAVKLWPSQYLKDLEGIKKFILSRDSDYKVDKDFTLVNSPEDAIEKAREMGIDNLIVTGGPNINSEFAKLNLIGEIILNLESVLTGSGLSLFKDSGFQIRLELTGQKKITDSILQLHYKVVRN